MNVSHPTGHVLIIEDDREVSELLVDELEQVGIVDEVAIHGTESLDDQIHQPDIEFAAGLRDLGERVEYLLGVQPEVLGISVIDSPTADVE